MVSKLDPPLPKDMTPDVVTLLEKLMLAQAQVGGCPHFFQFTGVSRGDTLVLEKLMLAPAQVGHLTLSRVLHEFT